MLGQAWPAAAHGHGTYRTGIVSVRPAVTGLSVSVANDGSWVQVTNAGATAVVVLGLDDEPYLRVSRDGVWRNDRSPTAQVAGGNAGLGPTVDAEPRWSLVSARHVVRFRDIRVPRTTAQVRAPDRAAVTRVISRWSLPLMVGTTPVTVRGTLTWRPWPVPWTWIAGVTAGGVGFLALVAVAMRQEGAAGELAGQPRTRVRKRSTAARTRA